MQTDIHPVSLEISMQIALQQALRICVFQAEQGGQVGITLDCEWGEPMSNSVEDQAAAQRRVESQLGWYEVCCTFCVQDNDVEAIGLGQCS